MLFFKDLQLSWRHIFKYKLFSFINIVGLSIGLVTVILITLFVQYELSYDQSWTKTDNIYRVNSRFDIPNRGFIHMPEAPGPLFQLLKEQYPEKILAASRLLTVKPRITYQHSKTTTQIQSAKEDVIIIDPDFIKIFDIDVLQGHLDTAMSDKNSIVLTPKAAHKFFGHTDVINRVLKFNWGEEEKAYKVAALIQDFPKNSVLEGITVLSLIDEQQWSAYPSMLEEWFAVNTELYLLLSQVNDADAIQSNMIQMIDSLLPSHPFSETEKTSNLVSFNLMNIQETHLQTLNSHSTQSKQLDQVLTFAFIAMLVLGIACINFMNLSTARSSLRAKEVALKKVLGASRLRLIIQFLSESLLITCISFIIALALAELILPYFNAFIGKDLTLNYWSSNGLLLTSLVLFVGVLGGIYPAFVLSRFRPASVLKANKSSQDDASKKLRMLLVISQFTMSVALVIATTVIYQQMRLIDQVDLGFNKDHLLLINNMGRSELEENQTTLMQAIEQIPSTVNVTRSSYSGTESNYNISVFRLSHQAQSEKLTFKSNEIGYDFFKTYEIPILWGRDYSEARGDETPLVDSENDVNKIPQNGKIILNQSAIKALGFTSESDAIGKTILEPLDVLDTKSAEMPLEIIGIVPDIHFANLKTPVEPEFFALRTDEDDFRSITVKFTDNPQVFISSLEVLWQSLFPDFEFSYTFVDEMVKNNYKDEAKQAQLFTVLSGLAIVVACLGLYGLASFNAERRAKEIGIRKVMGAKIQDIMKLLIWQFSQPVMISNLIAWPLTFYFMSKWLNNFIYRIDNSDIILISIFSGCIVMLISWITVGTIAFNTARKNPIHALRND